jgi:altronate dehydratase large subunit
MRKGFLGYVRPDAQVGTRNHLLVMATCDCSYQEARRIADSIPGAVGIGQWVGCHPDAMLERQMAGIGGNPNIGAVILVGLGCESISTELIGESLKKYGKPVADVIIQRDGGSLKAIARGSALCRELMAGLSAQQRECVPLSKVMLAIQCGGSDATSGLAANPAVGHAVDRLVDGGATALFSEPLEMIGTGSILARRGATGKASTEILDLIARTEAWARASGLPSRHMPQGNMDGGLTTIDEKSMGAIRKGGTRPIKGVLRNNRDELQRPPEPGLYIQEGSGWDVVSVTHMAAIGAQVGVFTTGRGSTTGHAILPVIKVTGNPETYGKMTDNMDVNAGRIIEGNASIAEVGDEIFELVLRVASGEMTKPEILGFEDFLYYDISPVAANLMRQCD